MDERHQRRIAINEARFRAANEAATRAVDEFDGASDSYLLVCECALSECVDDVEVPRAAYARVRSNPRWFLVRPEHVMDASERTIEDHGGFWIIEKVDAGGVLAEELAGTDK